MSDGKVEFQMAKWNNFTKVIHEKTVRQEWLGKELGMALLSVFEEYLGTWCISQPIFMDYEYLYLIFNKNTRKPVFRDVQ